MHQNRLNLLIMLHVHKALIDALGHKISGKCVAGNEHCLALFAVVTISLTSCVIVTFCDYLSSYNENKIYSNQDLR